eukprot:Hpha_TRINITY_DN31625_c0_g1::TRINITY_DN31625_c0_g1_i1::g.29211::m.29211
MSVPQRFKLFFFYPCSRISLPNLHHAKEVKGASQHPPPLSLTHRKPKSRRRIRAMGRAVCVPVARSAVIAASAGRAGWQKRQWAWGLEGAGVVLQSFRELELQY